LIWIDGRGDKQVLFNYGESSDMGEVLNPLGYRVSWLEIPSPETWSLNFFFPKKKKQSAGLSLPSTAYLSSACLVNACPRAIGIGLSP